jgi:lipoprotein-anchoring transpeptidase ErfK/SrfK
MRAHGGLVIKLLAALVIVVVGIVCVTAAKEAGLGPFSTTLPVTLPTPHGLAQFAGRHSHAIPSDGWANHGNIHFSAARPRNHRHFRLQVELAHNGVQPSNAATATASADHAATVTVRHLGQGSYEWWARFYSGSAVSRWVPFSSDTAFKIDVTRPSTPVITSSTNPDQSTVYKSGTVSLAWHSSDSYSGLAGYRYTWDSSGRKSDATTTDPSLTKTSLGSGIYRLTVRAQDSAGNWSLPGLYTVKIHSTTPEICSSCYGFSRFAFNPHYSTLTFSYRVNEPVTARIGIYQQDTGSLERLVVQHLTSASSVYRYVWHGRDNHGDRVAVGSYEYVVRLTDAFGSSTTATYSNLQVLDKVIVVSTSQQKLWAYEDGKVVASTLVTTGNVNCCATPVGVYTILASYHPFTFRSPFPTTSFYYYPPSPVQYAMLFDTRGFYIHDAPWRTAYGPGTNQVAGQPGSVDTGTHGCVNVPLSVEAFLYKWAPVGTPVKILG